MTISRVGPHGWVVPPPAPLPLCQVKRRRRVRNYRRDPDTGQYEETRLGWVVEACGVIVNQEGDQCLLCQAGHETDDDQLVEV